MTTITPGLPPESAPDSLAGLSTQERILVIQPLRIERARRLVDADQHGADIVKRCELLVVRGLLRIAAGYPTPVDIDPTTK